MPKLNRIALTVSRRLKNKTLVIRSLHEGPTFSDTLLLHACFQVLTDYVRDCGESNLQDKADNSRDIALRELKELYDYWTQLRPLLISKEELAHEYEDRLEVAELREQRKSQDKMHLTRLIELRQFMTPV